MSSEVIFQASDLNQRGRCVLDAARQGEARIRDKDGMSLLVVPERRFGAAKAILSATANLMALEQALESAPELRSLRDFGDWTWLRAFDNEDLREFVRTMRSALLVSSREESDMPLEEALDQWRITAQQLGDPLRRAILLGLDEMTADDFVAAARPTS